MILYWTIGFFKLLKIKYYFQNTLISNDKHFYSHVIHTCLSDFSNIDATKYTSFFGGYCDLMKKIELNDELWVWHLFDF